MSCSETLILCLTQIDIANEKFFTEEIKKVKAQVEQGLGYYKEYKPNSTYFKDKKLKDYVIKFLDKICIYMNLSQEIVHNLFIQFIASDGLFQENQLKTLLNNGHATLQVMHRIRDYYYEERLSLIRLLKLALSGWHENWSLLSDVVFAASGCQDFIDLIKKMINDYKILADTPEPDWLERISICDDVEEMESFMKQLFQEKLEILEGLLLGLYSIEANPTLFVDVLKMFRVENFGRSTKIFHPIAKHTQQRVIDQITLFQSLIIIKLTRLDLISSDSSKHFLLADKKSLSALTKLSLGDKQSHGPLLLLSALCQLAFGVKPSSSNDQSVQRASLLAIRQLNVFSYLKNRLSVPPLVSSSASGVNLISVAANSILYDFLVTLFTEVHLNSLESYRESFLDLISMVLNVTVTYDKDKPLTGLVVLLEDLVDEFPRDLSLIRVCTSLMSESANDVVAFLSALPQYSDRIESFLDAGVLTLNADGAFDVELRRARYPYGLNSALCIPAGTKGRSLSGHVVVWSTTYSVWQVVLGELDIMESELIDKQYPSNQQVARIHQIVCFTEACLKANLYKDECCQVATRCWCLLESRLIQTCSRESSAHKLCAAVLRLVAMVVIQDTPDSRRLLTQLCQRSELLPHITSADVKGLREEDLPINSNSVCIPDDFTLNISLVSAVLRTEEMAIGEYPVTLAYLTLCHSLVQADRLLSADYANPPGVLIGGLVFAVHDVLAYFQTWKYQRHTEMLQVGEKCLLIFNECLTQNPSTSDRDNRVSLVQEILIRLISQSETAIRTLLSLSSISVATLRRENDLANDMLSLSGSSGYLSRLVWLSLTLLNHLLQHDAPKFTILPRLEASVQDGVHYMSALMTYLNYPHNLKMTRMAVNFLKRIVQLSSLPIVSCLGESSTQLRDVFLRRMSNPGECSLLRCCLFDLLSECVLCGRPGLLHLLLANQSHAKSNSTVVNGADSGSKQQAVAEEDSGCIECACDVLQDTRLVDDSSSLLLNSVLKFVSSLWLQDYHSVTRQIKEREKFWKHFTTPMINILESWKKNEERCSLIEIEIMSSIFSVLSMEIYANGWENCSSDLHKQVNELVNLDFNIQFGRIMLQLLSDNCTESYSVLYMCVGRWKSLLVLLLAGASTLNSSAFRKKLGLTSENMNNLSFILLTCLEHLDLSGGCCDDLDIGGQLASALAIITRRALLVQGKIDESLLEDVIGLVVKHCYTVPGTCTSIHIDLMVMCTLLIKNSDDNLYAKHNDLWRKLFSACLSCARELSLLKQLSSIEQKLLIHSINQLCSLIDLTVSFSSISTTQEWLEDLSSSGLVANLLTMLTPALSSATGLSLSFTIITLFTKIASSREGATYLAHQHLVDAIVFPAVNDLYQWTQKDGMRMDNSSDIKNQTQQGQTTWTDLLSLTIHLISNLLHNVGHIFLEAVAGFLSSHWPQFSSLGFLWSNTFSRVHLLFSQAVVLLIFQLIRYKSEWILYFQNHLSSGFIEFIAVNLYTASAYLLNPRYIQHMKNSGKVKFSCRQSSGSNLKIGEDSSNSLTDKMGSSVTSHLDGNLVSLITNCLSALTVLAPPVYDILYQPDENLNLLLDQNLSQPAPEDPQRRVSFGVLLAVLSVTTKMINRIDGRASPSKQNLPKSNLDELANMRQTVGSCQEMALSLLLSQTLIVIHHPGIDLVRKQQLIHGLSAEMSNNDRIVRRSLSHSRQSPNKTVSSNINFSQNEEMTFYRNIDRLLKTILR